MILDYPRSLYLLLPIYCIIVMKAITVSNKILTVYLPDLNAQKERKEYMCSE